MTQRPEPAPTTPTRKPALEAGAVHVFTTDHRRCDALWAAVEAAASRGDARAVKAAFEAFDKATRRHLEMEEEVLFPALDEVTGMTMGPTRMMRIEHQQMRGMLSQMALAAATDGDLLLEQGDTLWTFTQQHNMKEEGIVYPMAESHLRARWPDLADRLEHYLGA